MSSPSLPPLSYGETPYISTLQDFSAPLSITTRQLLIKDGAYISAEARDSSTGNAGNLTVNAAESVDVVGQSRDGGGSRISTSIQFDFQRLFSDELIEPDNRVGGNITISTQQLRIYDGGEITTIGQGFSRAGDITLNVGDQLEMRDGSISSAAFFTSGGTIRIAANRILLRGNSDIITAVIFGEFSDVLTVLGLPIGTGGDISITARSIIALGDSDILAFNLGGKGGNITFNTRAFFGQNYRPAPRVTNPATLNGNDRVDINASGSVSGIITLPDVSFLQNGLTDFPQTFTDTTQLLANSCIVRSSKQNGRFVITGSGGLPLRPGDAPLSSFPTGEVRGVEEGEKREEGREKKEEGREESYVIQNLASGTQQVPDRPWKIGDPIVEPQGIYKLANGDLVMSRECK